MVQNNAMVPLVLTNSAGDKRFTTKTELYFLFKTAVNAVGNEEIKELGRDADIMSCQNLTTF